MNSRGVQLGHFLPLVMLAGVACSTPAEDVATESMTSELTLSKSGTLMPFGGQDGTCVAVVGAGLQVATCGGDQTFTLSGSALKTSAGQCVDVRFGDLAAGVIDVTTCNGTINQQWLLTGGQIKSANRSDGRDHCLDVHFGAHNVATQLDLARCNGTAAQVFWTAGFTVDFKSSFSILNGSSCQSECLDVLFDIEQPGRSLDNSQCNGTNAQWYVLGGDQHIRLANNMNLCVGLSGPVQNGLAPIALETCNFSDLTQRWFFINRDTGTGGVSIANRSSGCLDVQGGSSQPATPVDAFTCNGTAAQKWFPLLTVPACVG